MSELKKVKPYHLFEKLKKDKKALLIISISFLGIFLIFFSEFTAEEDDLLTEKHIHIENTDLNGKDELKHIIGKIEGVGKVEVMITYSGSSEIVYASNISEQNTDSEIRREEEHIILDRGNIEDGLQLKEIYPEVTGIAVVCEGGGNPTVKNEITLMLKALYGISSNNISISEMNG